MSTRKEDSLSERATLVTACVRCDYSLTYLVVQKNKHRYIYWPPADDRTADDKIATPKLREQNVGLANDGNGGVAIPDESVAAHPRVSPPPCGGRYTFTEGVDLFKARCDLATKR